MIGRNSARHNQNHRPVGDFPERSLSSSMSYPYSGEQGNQGSQVYAGHVNRSGVAGIAAGRPLRSDRADRTQPPAPRINQSCTQDVLHSEIDRLNDATTLEEFKRTLIPVLNCMSYYIAESDGIIHEGLREWRSNLNTALRTERD